jgi:hypothetical protein
MNAIEAARRIGECFDEDGKDLCLHKLIFGRAKDIADVEGLLAVRPDLDLRYVRSWLVQMVPAGNPRLATLDDLERRFAAK